MSKPQLLKNVAILGNLHSGKTVLSDLIIESTFANSTFLSGGGK